MIGELIYTSAPAGLRPGSSGFCTVATTKGLSKRDQMTLEALSGYEFAFGISDPRAASNPTCFLHTIVASGSTQHVLSRVGFAGADHTGRSNKIAHHLLLTSSSTPPAGPAAVMRQLEGQERWATKWEGPARELDPSALPTGTSTTRPGAWGKLTGDQGWDGALARAFRSSSSAPAFVVFAPDVDVLALFEESLAVLPPEERWSVCFSTYYSATLPPDRPCHWRGVLAGSAAAGMCARHAGATVIDLTKPLSRLEEDEFTQAARKGEVVRNTVALTAPPKLAKPTSRKRRRSQPVEAEEPELVLELQAVKDSDGPIRPSYDFGRTFSQTPRQRSGLPAWTYFAAALLLAGLIALVPVLTAREAPLPSVGKRPPVSTQVATHPVADAGQSSPTGMPPEVVPRSAPSSPAHEEKEGSPLKAAARPSVAVDLAPANETPSQPTPAVGVSDTSQQEPLTLPVKLALLPISGPIDVATSSVATINTNVEKTVEEWRWIIRAPATATSWRVVDGRLDGYINLRAQDGDIIVRRGLRHIATLSLASRGPDLIASVTFTGEDQAKALDSLAFELQAEDKLLLLVPRDTSVVQEEELGFVNDPQVPLATPKSLVWKAPPNIQHFVYPDPRIQLKARSDQQETVELPRSTGERFSVLGISLETNRETEIVSLMIEGDEFASISKNPFDAASLESSIAGVVSAVHDRRLEKTRAGNRRTPALTRARRAETAAKKSAPFAWLESVISIADRMHELEISLVDPWGLPLKRIRYTWSWGWLEDEVKKVRELEQDE